MLAQASEFGVGGDEWVHPEAPRVSRSQKPTSPPPTARCCSPSAPARAASWQACVACGNPRAISPDGQYRGKYQFSMSTWSQMGGEGDPVDAPEWLQDRIALKLYRRAGTSPWPNCP